MSKPIRKSRILRDQRGTAITEAVIMMPTLILVWPAILFGYQLARQLTSMTNELRSDTWAYHYAACNGTAPDSMVDVPLATGGGWSIVSFLVSVAFPAEHQIEREFSAESYQPMAEQSVRKWNRLTWMGSTEPQRTSLLGRVWDFLTS